MKVILIEPYEFCYFKISERSKKRIEEIIKASAQILMPEKISEDISNLKNKVNLQRFASCYDVERDTSLFPQEVTNSIFLFLN